MDGAEAGVYVVEVKALRHCFAVGLRTPLLGKNLKVPCFQIKRDGFSDITVSCLGNSSSDRQRACATGVVAIDRRLAELLSLQDGEEVVVRSVGEPTPSSVVSLEPLSADDWEIIELHPSIIEQQLLSQIRVVYPGLIFPFWINASTVVYMKAVSFDLSGSFALLDRNTEVRIAPVSRSLSSAAAPHTASAADTQPNLAGPAMVSNSLARSEAVTEPGNSSHVYSSSSPFQSLYKWSTAKLSLLHDSLSSGDWATSSLLEGSAAWHAEDSREQTVSTTATPSCEQTTSDYHDSRHGTPPGLCGTAAASESGGGTVAEQHAGVGTSRRLYPGVFRVQPWPSSASDLWRCCLGQPNLVIMNCETWKRQQVRMGMENDHSCDLDEDEDEDHIAFLSLVHKSSSSSRWLDAGGRQQREAPGDSDNTACLVTLRILCGSSLLDTPLRDGHVLLPETLRRVAKAALYHPVAIRHAKSSCFKADLKGVILSVVNVEMVEGVSFSYDDALKEAFVAFVMDNTCADHPWVISAVSLCTLPVLSKRLDIKVECLGASATQNKSPLFSLDAESLSHVHIAVKATESRNDIQSPLTPIGEIDDNIQLCRLPDLGGICQLAGDALGKLIPFLLSSGAHISSCVQPGLLVCGSVSTSAGGASSQVEMGTKDHGVSSASSARPVFGRSSLAQALGQYARECTAMAYVTVESCIDLRGKRGEHLEHKLRQSVQCCIECQPSVLILDDLDAVAPSPEILSEENRHLRSLSDRCAQVLCDLTDSLKEGGHRVALLATAADTNSLNPALLKKVFRHLLILPLPSADERHEILTKLVQHNELPLDDDVDLRHVARQADGYVVGDLQQLVNRACHFSACRGIQASESSSLPAMNPGASSFADQEHLECRVASVDFTEAMSSFVPALHQGVQSVRTEPTSFDDIGGLEDAKRSLNQALQLPAKYPRLFAGCPVRLTSGLLLYGMPGTGKTFLAKAVAQECSVRFIYVKGPELLNKYIGASEQAVRQVMSRALAAKPCVIFFDEFDALAPRRGHDSTGVTDRVVNQLLTQLDGVEGREGVFVLAATSRPDLIDPALLRPGRLDKSILCPLPDQDQRHSILRCLSKTARLADDVDLSELAKRSVNFTGADLRALLFNAQLAAVHEVQAAHSQVTSNDGQLLTAEHFAAALSSTKPSLPEAERRRLDLLYERFSKTKQRGETEMPKQRATLA